MISLPGPLKKVPPIAWVAIVGVVMVVLYLKSKGSATTASTAGTIVPSSGNGSAPIDPNAPATQVTLSSTDMATLLSQQQAQESAWLATLLKTIGTGGGGTITPPATTGAPSTALQSFVASLDAHQLHLYNKGLPGLQATLTAHQLHLQHLMNSGAQLATVVTVPKLPTSSGGGTLISMPPILTGGAAIPITAAGASTAVRLPSSTGLAGLVPANLPKVAA